MIREQRDTRLHREYNLEMKTSAQGSLLSICTDSNLKTAIYLHNKLLD
jgi:hypothetical protein